MSPPTYRDNQAGNAVQHHRQRHCPYSPCRSSTDFCCYRSIYFKAVFHSQPQQNSFILPHREHTSLHIISPLPSSGCRNRKPRSPLTFGVFAFISFVNQKQADFVLSAPVATCHFLVDYSADNHLLINPPARQRRLLVASYHLAVTLIFPVVAVFTAVIYPTANFSTRSLTISCVELSVEHGGQTFTHCAQFPGYPATNSLDFLHRLEREQLIPKMMFLCCLLRFATLLKSSI